MSTYQFVRQTLERERPDLYRALNPRIYHGAEQWESPAISAVHLGATLAAWTDPILASIPAARDLFTQMVSVTAARLIEFSVPTFFVARDLALAISRTDPPEDATWTDVHLPFPVGLFLLPREIVLDEAGNAYNYVTWCRVTAGERLAIPGGRVTGFGNDALIFSSASITDPEFAGLVKSLDANTWPHARMPGEGDYAEVSNLVSAERDVINALTRLALGLLMMFEARPALYTPGTRKKKADGKRGGRETWHPHVLGAEYRIPVRGEAQGGTHASPRLHWRRGFWRRQRHGADLSETKLIWIEPVLVGKAG